MLLSCLHRACLSICVVRPTFDDPDQDYTDPIPAVMQTMWRVFNPICKLLERRFPRVDSRQHDAFRNASMSGRKLILLGLAGIFWALFFSAAAYYLVLRFK